MAIAYAVLVAMAIPAASAEVLTMGAIAVPPYGIVDAPAGRRGIVVDFLEELARRAHIEGQVEIVPYQRLLKTFSHGDIMLTLLLPNPAIDAMAADIGTVDVVNNVVLMRKGAAVTSRADLAGKTLAVARGAVYDQAVQTDPAVNIVKINTAELGMVQALSGHIDGVMGTELGFRYLAKTKSIPLNQFEPPFLLNNQKVHLYLSKQFTGDRAAIAKAVADLKAEKFVSQLIDKYTK
jgi:ABC-type amino acid transport substrate-binding protein